MNDDAATAAAAVTRASVARQPASDKFLVRGKTSDPGFVAAVAAVLGLALPDGPDRSARAGGLALLWLSPTGWLLIGAGAREAAGWLAERLAGRDGDVIDVGDEFDQLRVAGEAADELLATSCAIDLSRRGLAVDAIARTLVAGIRAIAHRPADAIVDLYVDCSQADVLLDALRSAAREFA